ncbi:MAG: ROK family protein [Planifilum fimeticola]
MSFVMGRCIGVDVGGTKIAAARVEPDGSLSRRFRTDTRAAEGPANVIERICQGIEQVMGEESVEGIGIACPGPLNARTGVVLSPPNLPGWDRVPLKDRLEERFGVPVRVENDANAAAWGEYLMGAGRGSDPMIYITVSTGIGGGMVLDGRLYRGADTYAGEIGHTIVDPGGAPCGCGRRGCLEAMASGTAIARAGAEAVRKGNRRIRELSGGSAPRAEHVFAAYREGDEDASRIISETVRYLAIGISNIIHLFNPRTIVIGGGVARAGDVLFASLRERVRACLMPSFAETFELLPAKLGEDAGVIGAAALWAKRSE